MGWGLMTREGSRNGMGRLTDSSRLNRWARSVENTLGTGIRQNPRLPAASAPMQPTAFTELRSAQWQVAMPAR